MPRNGAPPALSRATSPGLGPAEDALARSISPWQRGMAMASIMFGTMIFIMNQTNVIVALPHMQGTFSATPDQISWVLTSFIVSLTIATAATGVLSARFGRKRLILAATAGFTISSFLCATAATLEQEVLFRALQGALGAPIIPLSQAIVMDIYPKERHGAALGLWGIGITVGPVFGPLVGGYVTEVYSWPWIFHFNVPIGAVVFLGLAAFVPSASRDRVRRMDWYGFAALALGLAAIQLVLNRGQRQDWLASSEIVIELALAGFCLYVFVVHSLTTRTPFIDRALFRDRNVVLGFCLVFAWGLMLHSPLVLLSLRLQGLGNYPVLETGILMAPRGVGGIVAMLVIGWLITRVSPKHLFVLGILCIAFASWIMSGWPIEAVDREVIFTAFLFGFGVAFAWVPLSILTFSTIDPRYRTEGVTFFNLLLNMGLGVGITIAIIVFSQGTQVNHEWLASFATPYNELFHDAHVPRQWSLDGPRGLSAFDAEVQRQAKTIAFNNAFYLIMLTALAVAPLIYFLSGPAARRRPLAAKTATD